MAAARRYGDPFTWPTFLGKVVVTGDPAGIKTLLSADPDIYQALGAELLGPVLGESNLILLSGERHRAMRKLQNPQFHGERLHAYGELITRIAEAHIGRWPSTQPFPIQATMQEISLDVILQAVLGLDEPAARASFKEAVLSLVAASWSGSTARSRPPLRRRLAALSGRRLRGLRDEVGARGRSQEP